MCYVSISFCYVPATTLATEKDPIVVLQGTMSMEGMSRQQLAQHAARLEDLILQHVDSLRMPNASTVAEAVSNATSDCDRCVPPGVQHQPVAHQ